MKPSNDITSENINKFAFMEYKNYVKTKSTT